MQWHLWVWFATGDRMHQTFAKACPAFAYLFRGRMDSRPFTHYLEIRRAEDGEIGELVHCEGTRPDTKAYKDVYDKYEPLAASYYTD